MSLHTNRALKKQNDVYLRRLLGRVTYTCPWKGGAYRIMLQQFGRAIAVTASNGHSHHILHRLHYVRGTEQEA
jgi:hypothetical protein